MAGTKLKGEDFTLRPIWEGRHVKIIRSKGRTPDALLGKFTDEATAFSAIKFFNENRGR